jgi:hypothetical protein
VEAELAVVRPGRMLPFRAAMYAMAIFIYALIPVALVMPFGPPAGHPAYLVAWALGAAISLVVVHRMLRKMMDGCWLTLTSETLTAGRNPPATVRIADIVDTIPILSRTRLLGEPQASVNPEQFTVVLLRLRDGSRLPLSARQGVEGFTEFLKKLLGMVGPTIRTQGEVSSADRAVLGPRMANRVHGPAHQAR